MEIREPIYKVGDKVYCEEFKCNAIIIGISDYSFANDEYYYSLRYDDGDNEEMIESMLRYYQEPPKTVWELQKGDKCFFINSIGSMIPVKWDGTYCAIRNLEIGNVFLTKEEAEFEVERRKIEAEMLTLGGRRKFKNNRDNCGIYHIDDSIYAKSYRYVIIQGLIYFDSIKEAEDAIKTIGEDRIKKYIFGVEE